MNSDNVPKQHPLTVAKQVWLNSGIKVKLTLLTVFLALLFTAGTVIEYQNKQETGHIWDRYQANMATRQPLINDITSRFGYGGLIHQFKDYILRQDEQYHQLFMQSYEYLLSDIQRYQALPNISLVEQQALSDIIRVANQYRQSIATIRPMIERQIPVQKINTSVIIDDASALNGLALLQQYHEKLTQQVSGTLHSQLTHAMVSLGVERIVSFLLLTLLAFIAIRRGVIKPIKQLIEILSNINEGKYENRFEIRNNSEFGKLFQIIYVTQTKLNVGRQESRRFAEEALQIKNALDNVTVNVMVTDSQCNIIYMNDAAIKTLKNAEADINKEQPNFNIDKLLGASIDVFFQLSQHQQQMFQALTSSLQTNILIGGRTMSLTMNPMTNAANEHLGTAIEWCDKTAEIAIEQEIDALVIAAANGDLSKRMSLEGKDAIFTKLSSGLNELLDSSSSFVRDVGSLFSRLADGDLTQPIHQQYNGEFQKIKEDANHTVNKLTRIINQISLAADTVHTAAHEIALGNSDLSQRTKKQACSLEATASSMQQITASVKQSAEHTDEANQLATDARNKAQRGKDTVQDAVSAMKEILAASKRINGIIAVIDEIAFQTNLMTLNAAVEAARAGEQGRGFAIVAREVRNLSQRSAAAAKEIKDLLRDNADKVKIGSALINDSGETLKDIAHSVGHVAKMISAVSHAASEQSSGLEQINLTANQMDEVTQQNAALVAQTSVAGATMSNQVNHMTQLIQFFKIEQEDPSNEATEALLTEPKKDKIAPQNRKYSASAANHNSTSAAQQKLSDGNRISILSNEDNRDEC